MLQPTANGHGDGSHANKRPRLEKGLQTAHTACLVLDYGSQYTQLIARRVRDLDIFSMLLPGDATLVSNPDGLSQLLSALTDHAKLLDMTVSG